MSGPNWVRCQSGGLVLCLLANLFGGRTAWADDPRGAAGSIDDIERRIQHQAELNRRTIRSLIGTLESHSKAQRDELRAAENELGQARSALSVLGEVPDPLESSPVGLEPTGDGVHPSPGSPVRSRTGTPSNPVTQAGLPALPGAAPVIPKEELPMVGNRVRRLTERVRELRKSVPKVETDLSRARSLLKSLGDDSAPPVPSLKCASAGL